MPCDVVRGSPVDIPEFIDRQPFGRFHLVVVLLCAAALYLDGFDVQAIGYAAPSISEAWHLAPGALGPVFGASVVGLMVGALIFSPLADRRGRRPVLILCLVLATVGTVLTATATTLTNLLVIRFFSGLGLGGAMPIAIALISEYSPSRLRARMVIVGFCGYPLGSASAGVVAAVFGPAFGWQSLFIFGSVLALVLVPVLFVALPESVRVLVLRGGDPRRILAILARLDPSQSMSGTTAFVTREETAPGSSVLHLFRNGRLPVTILLWVIFLVSLLDLFLINNWLPTMISRAGFPLPTAAIATSLFQTGGIVGALTFGWLIDRAGVYRVLSVGYLLAAVFISAIGVAGGAIWLLMAVVLCAGFCVVGGQISLNALAARFYPTHMRSTGVGWALGVGRIGSFAGPVIGGIMLSWQWQPSTIFLAAAIPAVIGACAIARLSFHDHLAGDDRGGEQRSNNGERGEAGAMTAPMGAAREA